MPAAVATEGLSGTPTARSMAGPATARLRAAALLAMEPVVDHRHSSRRLDALLDDCVAHLVLLGHGARIQRDQLAG